MTVADELNTLDNVQYKQVQQRTSQVFSLKLAYNPHPQCRELSGFNTDIEDYTSASLICDSKMALLKYSRERTGLVSDKLCGAEVISVYKPLDKLIFFSCFS